MPADADLVVIGGGLGGLSAALAAAGRGIRVTLIERSRTLGGAVLLSAGSLWTFPTVDDYLAQCPEADPALARRVVSSLGGGVSWLRRLGVEVADRGRSVYGPSTSKRIDPVQLVDRLSAALMEQGEVRLGSPVTSIEPRDGAVHVASDDGAVDARAVVVATGGVHADPGVLRSASLDHYVGLAVRNRPRSGDGVRIALAHGASLAGTADGIYGHLVPAGLPDELATEPLAAQYQSVAGVLITLDGELLVGPGARDHDLNRLVARVPGRRAVLLYDSAASPFQAGQAVSAWATERTAFSAAHGERVASEPTMAALVREVAGWGVAVQADALEVAERSLRTAPFTAVMVQPSITHAGVGIQVDASLRAVGLDRVYVAGADIGRAFGDGYGGGISFALTTGLAAGTEAAKAITGARDPIADDTPGADRDFD